MPEMPPAPNNLRIQNRQVRTIVIPGSTESDSFASLSKLFSASLSDLLSSVPTNDLVALDIQTHYSLPYLWSSTSSPITDKAAALTLCAGHLCLIIHLLRINFTPPLLTIFLDRPNLSIAGVGIHASLALLKRDYDLTCRNAVDLGWLAASLRQKWDLEPLGLAALAKGAGVGDVSFKLAGFADWSVEELSAEQVESAVNQAFLTCRVANKLLNGEDVDK